VFERRPRHKCVSRPQCVRPLTRLFTGVPHIGTPLVHAAKLKTLDKLLSFPRLLSRLVTGLDLLKTKGESHLACLRRRVYSLAQSLLRLGRFLGNERPDRVGVHGVLLGQQQNEPLDVRVNFDKAITRLEALGFSR